MDFILLLAQDGLPPVDKAIDWSERASRLGVAGICLFVMFIALGVAWWVMRKNSAQAVEIASLNAIIAGKEQSFRVELVESKDAIAALERGYRADTERLLREMIERGEDTGEVLNTNTQALRDMTQGLQQLTTRIEYVERKVNRGGGVA